MATALPGPSGNWDFSSTAIKGKQNRTIGNMGNRIALFTVSVYNANESMKATLMLLALSIVANGADWLNIGGDAQHSGWQQRERELNPKSISRLRMIWKRKLDGPLSAPVILGHLKSYRGTVELVFTVSAAGTVYAIDGDFGKTFWERRLATGNSSCPQAQLAIAPSTIDEDEDDDAPQPVRPLYVLAGDGLLHTLDPVNGLDRETKPFCDSTAELTATPSGPVAAPASKSTRDQTQAYKIDSAGRLTAYQGARKVWTTPRLESPGQPAVAGGIVFTLTRGSQPVLYAFDAATGKQLYSSGNAIHGKSITGDLAIANGHIVFTTIDGTIYCFGFPVDP